MNNSIPSIMLVGVMEISFHRTELSAPPHPTRHFCSLRFGYLISIAWNYASPILLLAASTTRVFMIPSSLLSLSRSRMIPKSRARLPAGLITDGSSSSKGLSGCGITIQSCQFRSLSSVLGQGKSTEASHLGSPSVQPYDLQVDTDEFI